MGKGGGLKARGGCPGHPASLPQVSKGRKEGTNKPVCLEGLGALCCHHLEACPLP